MPTVLLFSSNIRPLYEQDILNLTAVPIDTRYRFRYRGKYVDEGLRTQWGPGLVGSEALILYSLQQIKQYQEAAFIPIRAATVLRAYVESEDIYVVEFSVGRSASLSAVPASTPEGYATEVTRLKAFLSSRAAVPYPASASLLRGALTGKDSPIEISTNGAEDLALFERTTKYLSGVVSLADVRYLRVAGVFPREAWAKGDRTPVAREEATGSVVLRPGRSYVVEIMAHQPTDPVLAGSFDLGFDDDVVQVAGPKVISINSMYDLITVELHAQQLGDDVERTGAFTVTPSAGTRGASVTIPLKVALGTTRTAATLAVSVGGLALVGLPAIFTDLPFDVRVAILAFGALASGFLPFALRKSLPWKL